jgi:hypothetical protein
MPAADQMIAQFLDPFRIGLLVALVLTAYNTAGTIGIGIPLVLGCVFVAVIIPITTQAGGDGGTMAAILTGIVVNAVIVGLILGARALWLRLGAAGRQ